MKKLDLSRPVESLLEITGLTRSELARRLGVQQSAIPQAIRRGAAVQLDTLMRFAGQAGTELEIRIRRAKKST